jgi:hypothetical protein
MLNLQLKVQFHHSAAPKDGANIVIKLWGLGLKKQSGADFL